MAHLQPVENVKITTTAPGKVILHGEHSVVYGKLAIAATLDLRTRIRLEEYTPETQYLEQIRIHLNVFNFVHHRQLSDIKTTSPKILDQIADTLPAYNYTTPQLLDHEKLLRQVVNFTQEPRGDATLEARIEQSLYVFYYLFFAIVLSERVELRPFEIVIDSELVVGAGTGSSASFSVALAAILIQYVRARKGEPPIKEFSAADLDLISRWGYEGEKIIHGTPSGIDNTICTYGAMLEFHRGQKPKLRSLKHKLRVILIDTRVPRNTKALVRRVAVLRYNHTKLVDGIMDSMDEAAKEALECIVQMDEATSQCASTKELYDNLKELAEINHHLLGSLGVGHPKLDEACTILQSHGLYAKLTGAGGGGFAISVVAPSVGEYKVESVIAELNSKGFHAVFTGVGGRGVLIE